MRRGVSLVEALIAMALVTVAFFTVMAFLSISLRQSTQTRHRALALILAENLSEEIEDHPYGQPPPARWNQGRVEQVVVVEGRRVKTDFEYSVVQAQDGNGSFFNGRRAERSDRVEVTVVWSQPTGSQGGFEKKELKFRRTVWRDKDVFAPEP